MSEKIRIVIVDDHQMFLDGIISVLSSQENYEILFVETDATKALLKIKNNIPDIVITDISMPIMNGIEFIKQIKILNNEIKILVLSMFNNFQRIDNIDGYLLKETDKKQLIESINQIVLHNKKCFSNDYISKIESYEFGKSILSEREKDIIRAIADEFTTEEIAEKLHISKHTVETHRKNIFLKLKVKNIAGLIKAAISLGII